MTEEWRTVVGWDGYEVSNLGNLRSYRKRGPTKSLDEHPHLITPSMDRDGYMRVQLSNSRRDRQRRGVHQFVAETFLAETWFPRAIVLHNNGKPADNRVENLRWGTHADNTRDRERHGTLYTRTPEDITEMRRLYQMGFHQDEIARVFRTSPSYIQKVVTYKKRKDVA